MVRIATLCGDGISPEIVGATCAVIEAVKAYHKLDIALSHRNVGFHALKEHGVTITPEVIEHVQTCDGFILGPVSHNAYPPREEGGLNPSGELRRALTLYANIRPARSRANIPPKAGMPIDIVVVRENTEGFYADRNMYFGQADMLVTEDVAVSMRRITRSASIKIARQAFDLATTRSGRVTAVHKANVLRQSCGLFLSCCREVAVDYPQITYKEELVDAMAAHLVRAPQEHDVIVTTNMFGDIISDLAAELSGSLGLGASLNSGRDHAMAQAQHGSAPDIAGQGIANPSSLIGSTAMLFHWLGQKHNCPEFQTAAAQIDGALESVLSDPAKRTRDLGGPLGTEAFTDALITALGHD